MQKFKLCPFCSSLFRKGKGRLFIEGSPCYICEGRIGNLDSLLNSALEKAKPYEWENFFASSSVPKEFLAREQDIFDWLKPGDFLSMKNLLNRQIVEVIEKQSGKKASTDSPDLVIELNFRSLEANAKPVPVFVFGRYQKLSRKHCQSRWQCSDCGGAGCSRCFGSGQNYDSVEGEIGKVLQRAFLAKDCILHASGREDVDVRAIGSGRPFVAELPSPAKRSANLSGIEGELMANPDVRASGLKIVKKHFIRAVCESHFDKEYCALVSADRPLDGKDAQTLQSLDGRQISQKTPKRVLSRRVDIVRTRKIYRVSAEPVMGGRLKATILAEAGTYIKELISSDGGRTSPSFSEILSCMAKCDELDVIQIYDYFLETVIP